MPKIRVAVTLDAALLARINDLIAQRQFPNRSQAIAAALTEKLDRLNRSCLARECGRLDPREEKALAQQGLAADLAAWPEY
jgi:Arc/MetJ-type ribon-helix-helix transcriptional regulator